MQSLSWVSVICIVHLLLYSATFDPFDPCPQNKKLQSADQNVNTIYILWIIVFLTLLLLKLILLPGHRKEDLSRLRF